MAQTENPMETLMVGARCVACIPEGKRWDVIIYLLATMANITLDPEALMVASRCVACVPEGKKLDIIIYLLLQGAIAGGGSTISPSDPTGTGNDGELWININTNNVWVWNGSAWQQLIGP